LPQSETCTIHVGEYLLSQSPLNSALLPQNFAENGRIRCVSAEFVITARIAAEFAILKVNSTCRICYFCLQNLPFLLAEFAILALQNSLLLLAEFHRD
jgi:hypothetical protein